MTDLKFLDIEIHDRLVCRSNGSESIHSLLTSMDSLSHFLVPFEQNGPFLFIYSLIEIMFVSIFKR